jgi:hypothetical protein
MAKASDSPQNAVCAVSRAEAIRTIKDLAMSDARGKSENPQAIVTWFPAIEY